MKSVSKVHWSRQWLLGTMFMVMVLVFGLGASFESHAESKGKVVAPRSVNIRQEASTDSTAIGSAERGAVVDIKGQVTASDGKIWYQVYVNGTTVGYIRSDLIEITDGTTPPTVNTGAATTPGTDTPSTPSTPINTVGVEAVEPMSATVTNSRTVRVRAGASTNSAIVTTAQNGVALTVTGRITGEDAKVWYQVNFIADGTEVVGFIRSDYVALSGELVPVTEEPPVTETPPIETPPVEEEPKEDKEWDTQLQNGEWYLLNKVKGEQTKITEIYEGVALNKALYEDALKEVKSQKVIIIILVLVAVAATAVAVILIMKFKDMKESAYISQVEKETLHKRNTNKAQGGKLIIPTLGGEKNQTSKPQGNKNVGAQTVRPQRGRPAGASGQAARLQGGRPAGAPGQAARPQGGQPQGGRPAGAPGQPVRPQDGQSQNGQPQDGSQVIVRPKSRPVEEQSSNGQKQGWQSKNFLSEEDEFEFEYLNVNWDGKEE